MVSNIVINEDFKYRKTLKEAKAEKNEYILRNTRISEVQILKNYKRAARRSELVEEYISCFQDRKSQFSYSAG